MWIGGPITKGLRAQDKLVSDERIFLFSHGNNEVNLTQCWDQKGYSLYNGKTIVRGYNPHTLGSNMEIESTGVGTSQSVLLGTQISVPTNLKRFLVVEAKVSDDTAAADFAIVLSKTKALTNNVDTVFYTFSFKELFLKFYIDLSELSGFTRAYISIVGGAKLNWASGASLEVSKVYLTNYRHESIIPLYNRGNDFGTYVEGQDADALVGWEGYNAGGSYEAASLEDGYIDFAATASKQSWARILNARSFNEINRLCLDYEPYEVPAGSPHIYINMQNAAGEPAIITSTLLNGAITQGTRTVGFFNYLELRNSDILLAKNRLAVGTSAGLKIKLYGVWVD